MTELSTVNLQRKPIIQRGIHLTNALAIGYTIALTNLVLDYVARGREHGLRDEQRELDRSNLHVLDDAPDFIVATSGGESRRWPMGSWAIELHDGTWALFTADEVTETFEMEAA